VELDFTNPMDDNTDRLDFLEANYPKNLNEVSRKWLSKLLQKELTAHSLSKVLEAGVTAYACSTAARPAISLHTASHRFVLAALKLRCSDAAIFDIKYAAGVSGPASICLEYAKETETNREFAMGADMYKKEIFFFNDMYKQVAAVMTIPEAIGVFIDPEKPDEFFCIAMEDLNLSNYAIDQIEGIDIEACKQLGSMTAKFHAAFWEHVLLKDDVVCAGKPDAAAIFFEGWAVAAMVRPASRPGFCLRCVLQRARCAHGTGVLSCAAAGRALWLRRGARADHPGGLGLVRRPRPAEV
jgi:hypothetical protein